MISEKQYKIADKPIEVVIEISSRCNLRCNFCYYKNSKNTKELNTKNWKKIIDKISKIGASRIKFTGGEPLVREDLLELVSYAKMKGLYVMVNTNGQLFNNFFQTKNLVKYVDNFLVSLHGYDNKSEAKFTGIKNSFEKKIRAIKLLRVCGAKVVRCCTIATNSTIKNIDKIFSVVKTLNLDAWEIVRPVKNLDYYVDRNNFTTLIEKMLQFQKEHICNFANAVPFCAYEPIKTRELSIVCGDMVGGRYDDSSVRFIIATDGHIKPNYYIDVKLGNAKNDNILKCWNNKFAKKMRSFKYLPHTCKSCKFVVECRGGLTIIDERKGSFRIFDPLASAKKYKKSIEGKNN